MIKMNKRDWIFTSILLAISLLVLTMVFPMGGRQVYTIGIGDDSVKVLPISGLVYTFGGDAELLNGVIKLKFNSIAFCGFFLPFFFCIVYLLLQMFVGKKSDIFILFVSLAFLASTILLLLSNKFMIHTNELNSELLDQSQSYKLGIGTLLGASFSTCGLIASLVTCYYKLVK